MTKQRNWNTKKQFHTLWPEMYCSVTLMGTFCNSNIFALPRIFLHCHVYFSMYIFTLSEYFFPSRTATGRKWPMVLLRKHSQLTTFVFRLLLALHPSDVSTNLPWPSDFRSARRQPWAGGGGTYCQLSSTIRFTGKPHGQQTGGGRRRGTQELQKTSPLSHV